jgi:hypothetical protein
MPKQPETLASGYAVLGADGKVVTFPSLEGGGVTTHRALAIYERRATANRFCLLGSGERVQKVRITVT